MTKQRFPFRLLLRVALFATCATVLQASATTVTVSPASVQVAVGGVVQFTATVTGSSLGLVVWGLSGSGCLGQTCGTITSDGIYTAPAVAPSPSTVTVTATSIVDGSFGTATVTVITSGGVKIVVAPSTVAIAVNGQQQFKATVTGTGNTSVTWSISGTGCNGNSCGTITSNGLYTAPPVVPSPPTILVTATSVADTTKSASASVTINQAQSVTVKVSPGTAQVPTGGQQQFTATVTGSTNKSVTWSIAGTGCQGVACGTINSAGLYKAPIAAPNPPTIAVTATSVAAPTQSGTAVATIISGPSVTVSPANSQIAINSQLQFTATVSNNPSTTVIWSISGAGCSGLTCGKISSSGLYTAPASVPVPAVVMITATLLSNSSVSGSASVTITGPQNITVSVAPTTATVAIGGQQQFTATVSGSTNMAVTWAVSGLGCSGSSCGTITAGGLYTAPSVLPSPSSVTVTATSKAAPTASASATVSLVAAVAVTVSPSSAQVKVGAQQQFKAQVSGSSDQTVYWSVGGSGCSGSSCGVISSSGLYTAPAVAPTPPTVTIKAVADADSTKSSTATVTIVTAVAISISPTSAMVTVGAQQQFQATVTGTSDHTVLWSVSGSGCSGATCGTISAQGLYTAPNIVPTPHTVVVTAKAHADQTKSASSTVTIMPSSNSKLKGRYAFLFKGFDQLGVYQAVGSITADGGGNITGGSEDVNNVTAPQLQLAVHGTYLVRSDNRGTVTLVTARGTSTYTFALNSAGDMATLQEFDSTGVRGSGVLKLQNPAAFAPSQLNGGYALSLTGFDFSGGRIGALAAIFPDGTSGISGSSMDVNDAGNLFTTFSSFTGSYTVSATGRGTARLSVPGFGGGIFNFALYVVSSSEFVLLSIDPVSFTNPIFAGTAEAQTGTPFTSQSFIKSSIFHMTGQTFGFPQTMVGILNYDGNSGVSGRYDQNSGGNITITAALTGTYAVNNNGRGGLNVVDAQTGSLLQWTIYAISPNRAFVMDSSASVNIGEMKKQALFTPVSNSSFEGNFAVGSGETVTQGQSLTTGASQLDGATNTQGRGAITGTWDQSLPSVLNPNQVVVGTYNVSLASNNGRGNMSLTSPSAAGLVFWMVNGSEVFAIDTDVSDTMPSVLFFEQ
jgi:Fe-S cluster assembly iron-binding protein IscA